MEVFFPASLDPVLIANLILCLFWLLLAFDPDLPLLKITHQLIHHCLLSVAAAVSLRVFGPSGLALQDTRPTWMLSLHVSPSRLLTVPACSLQRYYL